jgi:hypothetical protein
MLRFAGVRVKTISLSNLVVGSVRKNSRSMFAVRTAGLSKISAGWAWTAAAASLTAATFSSQPTLCLWGATPAASKEESLIKESDELYKKGEYAKLKVRMRCMLMRRKYAMVPNPT